MYQGVKRVIFISTKIIFGLLILINFRATLVACNEDIPFCHESLEALKDDVKDWQERCMQNKKLHDRHTPCCKAEEEYNQNRRRLHRKLCFYKGNHRTYLMEFGNSI